MKTYQKVKEKQDKDIDDLPGYPEYDKDEDIYPNARKEDETDPDDDLEDIGKEDEENNYYDNDDLEYLI